VDSTLLAQETLTNLTATLSNFRTLSERSLVALENINTFVVTNSGSLSTSVVNFATFTENLNLVTTDLRNILGTNSNQIRMSIQNIETATGQLTNLLAGINSGEGLAGKLLKNEEMATHIGIISSNFAVLSSNINNKGLWGVLRKPKKSD
jgi:hypothetical protein